MNHEAGIEAAAAFHKRGTPLSFLCADLARETEVKATFDKIIADHGRIDLLVNVAGGSLHRHTLEEFPLHIGKSSSTPISLQLFSVAAPWC